MSLPFLRTLQGDRFFQLLILVGVGLSFLFLCTEILACCYRLAHHHHLKRPDAAD